MQGLFAQCIDRAAQLAANAIGAVVETGCDDESLGQPERRNEWRDDWAKSGGQDDGSYCMPLEGGEQLPVAEGRRQPTNSARPLKANPRK